MSYQRELDFEQSVLLKQFKDRNYQLKTTEGSSIQRKNTEKKFAKTIR